MDIMLIPTLDVPNATVNAWLVQKIQNNAPNANLATMNNTFLVMNISIVENVTHRALAVPILLYANHAHQDTIFLEQAA